MMLGLSLAHASQLMAGGLRASNEQTVEPQTNALISATLALQRCPSSMSARTELRSGSSLQAQPLPGLPHVAASTACIEDCGQA